MVVYWKNFNQFLPYLTVKFNQKFYRLFLSQLSVNCIKPLLGVMLVVLNVSISAGLPPGLFSPVLYLPFAACLCVPASQKPPLFSACFTPAPHTLPQHPSGTFPFLLKLPSLWSSSPLASVHLKAALLQQSLCFRCLKLTCEAQTDLLFHTHGTDNSVTLRPLSISTLLRTLRLTDAVQVLLLECLELVVLMFVIEVVITFHLLKVP